MNSFFIGIIGIMGIILSFSFVFVNFITFSMGIFWVFMGILKNENNT
jgi:hypothetical protein|tara:strand:+ start:286 stop:426 length:141 start_codon:yes stop_codon:yes gene_type:complete